MNTTYQKLKKNHRRELQVNKISLQEICDIIYSDISVSQYLVKGKHLKGVTENYFVSCCRGKEGQLNGMDPQGIRSNDPDKEGR